MPARGAQFDLGTPEEFDLDYTRIPADFRFYTDLYVPMPKPHKGVT